MQRSLELNKKNDVAYAVSITQGRISTQVIPWISKMYGGRIHSCFKSSLNLEVGKHLIHLGTDRPGLCCFGISVSDDAMAMILDHVKTGDRVVCRPGQIRIYGICRIFLLYVGRFASVDLKIPVCGENPAGRDGLLYQELEKRAVRWIREKRLGMEPDASFYHFSQILVKGSDPEQAVCYFLGRGKGLTPGGDDLLTGYGAVLTMFGNAELLRSILHGQLAKTTDVSRAYLGSMENGYANEVFVQLLDQFFLENLLDIRELLCKMEEMGHTSGCDTLYGMYLALKKFKEETIV